MVEHGGKNKKVFVTGHSLGGAMAVLCAYRLQEKAKIDVYGVYTYGCPRVGNLQFFLAWGNAGLGPRSWMVRNVADVVAQIVPTPPFKHVGGVKMYSLGHSMLNYARAIYDTIPGGNRPRMPARP